MIAFEGTGAFEPLIPPTISEFMKCFSGKLDPSIKNKVYSTVREIHKDTKGKDSKWSTLQSGIMSELTKNKEANKVDWYSFPSEEVEQLAGLEELGNTSVRQLYNDIKNSIDSNPKGIQNARDCIKNYMAEASKLGISPKVVIVSHSSGGRSLVKFTQHVKKDLGIDIDLAYSIDPVKEAHHAVEEVVPQKIGEPWRYTKWKVSGGKGKDYPYSAVWSRDQPSVLYKSSNVKKHINFYQTEDRLGLKMGGDAMRFGINGSRMHNAENIHLSGFGADAHGPVGYHKKVLERFNSEMEILLK
ncbi:MAG: hypothetical protein GY909_09075 [Oligoflexia bacterium]|nr:hypothetical protein [Oligoflexia bacterium]